MKKTFLTAILWLIMFLIVAAIVVFCVALGMNAAHAEENPVLSICRDSKSGSQDLINQPYKLKSKLSLGLICWGDQSGIEEFQYITTEGVTIPPNECAKVHARLVPLKDAPDKAKYDHCQIVGDTRIKNQTVSIIGKVVSGYGQ